MPEEALTWEKPVQSVHEGMRNQSLGAEQINEAMVQLTHGIREA